MDTDNLVHMANRIGEFFQTMPEREQALLEITQHLCKFWAPRMRRELLAHVDHTGGDDLLPIVRQALLAHRHELI
jgi:formate dehydrogenase subunit delta